MSLTPAAVYLAEDLDLAVDLSPQRNDIDPQRIRSPPSHALIFHHNHCHYLVVSSNISELIREQDHAGRWAHVIHSVR